MHPDLKVIWVDAHPDAIDPALRQPDVVECENYHGMPVSHVTGMAALPKNLPYFKWLEDWPRFHPKNLVFIGLRDIDADEYITLQKHSIKCFTMDHIDKYGIGLVMTMALEYLDPNNNSPFHISFDVDSVDPDLVGQTGTRFRYGLTPRESVHIVRRVAHERRLVSMDITEINEDLCPLEKKRNRYRGENALGELSQTVGLGVDLVTSVYTRYFTL